MRFSICILLSFSIFAFSGCKPDNGRYKLVNFNEANKASDDVYIRYLTNEIERFPEAEENYIKLSTIYERHNDVNKAIRLLEKALREKPESLDILLHLSSLYLQQERVEDLALSLRTIRKIDPDNMDFLKISAGYSLLLKDYTNAIFFANRAMLANPYDDENYFLRGSAQLINKDSINALISFEEAYKLKNSYKNFSKVFDVSLAVGDDNKAKKYLEEFMAKRPNNQYCYQWGAFYNETGRKDTAKLILMNCLQEKPDEERINFELGKIYFNENNIDSTLYYLNQYLDTNPKGTGAYVLKAKTLEKVSYYTDARKLYNAALEIDSTSTLAIQGLENLERKVAYLRLVNRKEEIQREVESLKPLKSKVIN
jgi:tetratricopeptide (TPR) repeat protein